MTNIRRYFHEGNTYFLTHVTYKRRPILITHADIFYKTLDKINSEYPFEIIALVLLPDHFHILIDPKENDLSKLMRKLKLTFSAQYRSRHQIKSGRIWQYRYWDHIIRNQDDFNKHIDYIHYNPVKHELADKPFDWEHSSIHEYLKNGYYNEDWGVNEGVMMEGEYGE